MTHYWRIRFRRSACLILPIVTAWLSLPAHGQPAGGGANLPALPSSRDQWLNSSPLTWDRIRGKAVVLWYFEETCPTCAGRWPALLQLAKDNSERPVLFIGVNSGTDPRELASYARTHNIEWPVIIDGDRSFERASGVNEISLQNIHQARTVNADGRFASGRWNDLPATVEAALANAAWKVKYDLLHPSMHTATRRMEFGDFQPAALAIKAGMRDKSPDVRRAARQMRGYVERQMQKSLEEAIDGISPDDAWGRYQALQGVVQRFAPHELPQEAAGDLKRLEGDPLVKEEARAKKAVDANAHLLLAPDERTRDRAVAVLERIVKNYPDTEGAARAEKLLAEMNTAPDAG